MKDKLAEEILKEKGFFVMTHKEGSEHVRKAFVEPIIKAMQAYHESKLRESKIVESFERENQYVTDEDIEAWAYNDCAGLIEDGVVDFNQQHFVSAIRGAKAMRDGKIKPVSRDNDC